MQPDNIMRDILVNLVSEGFGILVTIFVIDRILKLREEKRWLPSKHFLYRDMFGESLTVLENLVSLEQFDFPKIAYVFGGFRTASVPNINLSLLSNQEMFTLPIKIQTSIDKKLIDRTILEGYKDFIHRTILQSAHLIEPDLFSLLLQTQENLELTEKVNLYENSFQLYVLATDFGQIIEWLKKKATGQLSQMESDKLVEKMKSDFLKLKDDYMQY